METNSGNDILPLIARNLAGLANFREVNQLKDWIGNSEANKKYFEQVKNIWDISDREIDPKNIDTDQALKIVHDRIRHVSPERIFWHYWQKTAAILILPLLLGALLWTYLISNKMTSSDKSIYNEVYAAFGTRSSLRLADSTLVWLNSGSSLRYPLKFGNKNRHVILKGEAYFEVKSDPSRPFTVETSTLLVKATGTRFNVREYDPNPVAEVTLVSGKVCVNESDKGKESQFIAELSPEQHLSYNIKTKMKYINKDDTYKFIAWKDGKLIFRNEPLSEVVDKIGQMFNVDIELRGTKLNNYRYRATFHDESLGEILKLLKLSSPIDFEEVRREPLPDGSFPRKKVVIFPAEKE